MVAIGLSLGGLVGVLLSGGFVYWEVGRFAAPQVPVSLFNERRELYAYTAGLFVGVPLAVALVLYQASLANHALWGTLLFLGLLVGGGELAQVLLLRSRFWGSDAGRPFYALGFRAAIGGILVVALVAVYAAVGPFTWLGVLAVALDLFAVLALEVTGGLLAYPAPPSPGRPSGGPVSGLLLGLVGFFLIGLGPLAGPYGAVGAPLLALLGANLAYSRRRSILADVPPPTAAPEPPREPETLPYGRTPTRGSDAPSSDAPLDR